MIVNFLNKKHYEVLLYVFLSFLTDVESSNGVIGAAYRRNSYRPNRLIERFLYRKKKEKKEQNIRKKGCKKNYINNSNFYFFINLPIELYELKKN